ncbi:hypothetical protein OAU25_00480 [Crocinitomicaceae bacterium]|nr:hypothetical protein [Crocinitomicaceae bacterium]
MCVPALQQYFNFRDERPLNGVIETEQFTPFSWSAWHSGKYQTTNAAYLNTTFGFRSEFIRLNNQRHYWFFNRARANSVVVGKESYLYEQNYIKAFGGVDFIGADAIEEKSKKLKFIQERLKENGTDLYVLFAPGKGSYCSEYIPNKWKDKFNKHGTTNYKSYRNAFDRKKINYIDFNAWFLEMKETTPYPLFGKAGIHWSKYGEFLAADSLLQKIGDIRNAPMPDLVLDQITVEEKNRSGDYDIGEGMNLLFDLPTFPMGYPQFHWDWDTSQTQQIVTFVADSYFWGMFNYGFSRDLFGDGEFWYYNHLIYPDSYQSTLEVHSINIREKAEENDVIILLSTDANLYKFAFGFIDELYEAYQQE